MHLPFYVFETLVLDDLTAPSKTFKVHQRCTAEIVWVFFSKEVGKLGNIRKFWSLKYQKVFQFVELVHKRYMQKRFHKFS